MPISDSQRKAHDKYFSREWSQVKLSMPNDEATALRQYCADHGISVAGFIRQLVRDAIASGAVPGAAGDPVAAAAGPDLVQAAPVGDSAGAGVGRVTTANTDEK